jgi:hypothetical protein
MKRNRAASNELFPSLDWRYLLPDPAPATVVTIGGGEVTKMASRLVRHTAAPESRGADLVVTARTDRATLERARELVGPGGAVYVEAHWPRFRRAELLGRRLSDAGFSNPTVYSLSPSNDRWSPSWWVPVGELDAVRFVAESTELLPSSRQTWFDRRRSRFVRWLVKRERLMRRHPWLLHPTRRQLLAAVAVKPALEATAMPCEPAVLPPARQRAGERSAAVMRIGGSSTDQAMLFALGPGPQPRVVVKAPSIPEEVEASRREACMLSLLTDRNDPIAGVPRPVALPVDLGIAAWGQTFAAGQPLTRVLQPDNLERHAWAMTDWLAELARRTSTTNHDAPIRSTADVLAELGILWDRLPRGRLLERSARERLDDLLLHQQVCHHRDLGPWNVRTDGASLHVIDWADAVPAGPPLCDLHHCLAHLALCAFDAYQPGRRKVVVAAFSDEGSELGKLVADCLYHYAATIDLERAAVPSLRVLTWLLDLLRRPESERTHGIYLELLRAELS